MTDVEFFWDPVCPWAWVSSRWLHEVIDQRAYTVEWRFISLRIVNEEREMSPRQTESHGLGLRLLRVAAAARQDHGPGQIGDLYTAFGTRIHLQDDRASLIEGPGLPAALADAGLPTGLAEAADDDAWDKVVRADTEEALTRTGGNVGTPILTFGPPDGPSFFGPVISRIPRGAEALELWDSVQRLTTFPGFNELKRTVRQRPDFG